MKRWFLTVATALTPGCAFAGGPLKASSIDAAIPVTSGGMTMTLGQIMSAAAQAKSAAASAVQSSTKDQPNGVPGLNVGGLIPPNEIDPTSSATDSTARKVAASAASTASSAMQASTLGQPNGPAALDSTGAMSTVPLIQTQNLMITGPGNRTGVPTDPAALPGMTTVSIVGQIAVPLIPAPVTEVADAAANRPNGALVGDKFITVSSVKNVQPGEELKLLDPATGQCYGGDSAPVTLGIVGAIDPVLRRIYVDTSNQTAVGAFAYGRSQGLLTDTTGTASPPAREIGSLVTIPVGATVSFNNYSEPGVTVSGCVFNSANATPGGQAFAVGMSVGRVTDPYSRGVALGMSPYAILGPLANGANDQAFAMNPTVTAYPGSSGNLKGIELDLVNNSGNAKALNFGYWARSNGNTENGSAFMADGFGKSWFKAFYCHAGDQACYFDDTAAGVSTWDNGFHSVGAEYNGIYSVAAIGLPTARSTQVTTLYSSLSGNSGASTIVVNVPVGGLVPVAGSAIGNYAACNSTQTAAYTCGSTFTSGTTVIAPITASGPATSSGRRYTLSLSAPLNGGLGSGSNNVAIQTGLNSVEQYRWGHSDSGTGAYDPGIGAIGAVDWLLGPVPDGVGATFQIGPPADLTTIDQAGNIRLPAALSVAGAVKAAATQTTATLVAALPTCNAAAEGTRDGVTDSTTTTFLAAVSGGGSNHVPVYCDGTNWRVE